VSSRYSSELSQFQLVSTNSAGVAHPLPAELGPLPLYPLSDGFYSVIGPRLCHATPLNQANGSTNHTLASSPINISGILTSPGDKVFCGSSRCSGNRFASLLLYLCAYPPNRLTRGRGPHTCSRRSYTCRAPSCARPKSFRTKQALNRHYELVHLGERIDCPVLGCENVGEKGIKRYDNLIVHVKNVHRDYQLVDHGGSTWLIRRVIG